MVCEVEDTQRWFVVGKRGSRSQGISTSLVRVVVALHKQTTRGREVAFMLS